MEGWSLGRFPICTAQLLSSRGWQRNQFRRRSQPVLQSCLLLITRKSPPPSSEAGRNCPLVTIKDLAPTLTKTIPKCCWGRGEPHWTAASLFSAARWSGGMGLGNMGHSDCPCAPAGHQDSCYNSRPGSPVTRGSLSSAPPKRLPSAIEAAGRRALPRTGWQGSAAPWAVLSAV